MFTCTDQGVILDNSCKVIPYIRYKPEIVLFYYLGLEKLAKIKLALDKVH